MSYSLLIICFLLLIRFYILTIYILTITFSSNASISFNVYCNYELCEPVIHRFAFIPQKLVMSFMQMIRNFGLVLYRERNSRGISL